MIYNALDKMTQPNEYRTLLDADDLAPGDLVEIGRNRSLSSTSVAIFLGIDYGLCLYEFLENDKVIRRGFFDLVRVIRRVEDCE